MTANRFAHGLAISLWFGASAGLLAQNSSFAYDPSAEVKDGKTLTLRSAQGKPAWTPAADGVDGCGVAHLPLPRGTEM